MRVLTLDDMSSRQQAFRSWFFHYDHVIAWTAKEAIDALKGERFDLVQLDHDLADEHYLVASFGESEDPLPGAIHYKPGTGMDVVDYILTMPEEKRPRLVVVHSMNSSRSFEMYRRLKDAGVNAVKSMFDPNRPTKIVEGP